MKTVKELLQLKRDGVHWSSSEIEYFVDSLLNGSVSQAQAAAFLMASCIRGLNTTEVAALTSSMANSGEKLPVGTSARKAIDKHSTGGVGDKISLLLTPIAVDCGLAVPMISGRGLGHTGGTTDKLESVKGLSTSYSIAQMTDMLKSHHCFMVGQTAAIAPVDRFLYGLRDVTGTVENIGLIASSILSKKLAEGLDGLVMDMKVGSAAFMQSLDSARQLAEQMLSICRACNLPITFVFTRMDHVIGNSVGNWVEMMESETALGGLMEPDVMELTNSLAVEMLLLGNAGMDEKEAEVRVSESISSGRAKTLFHQLLKRQGGNWEESLQEFQNIPSELVSLDEGVMPYIDARALSLSLMKAGGGRLKETDVIDPYAGVVFLKRPTDLVHQNDAVARIYAGGKDACLQLRAEVEHLLKTAMAPVKPEPSRIIDIWRWG